MSKAELSDFKNIKLGPLIEKLGPLNNKWRGSAPSEKVLTLWAMGDVLLMALPKPSDSVLWEIQRRSYITRVVLRYALIVRRSWPIRADLEELVAGLLSYTVFREALPFLKGKREGIDDATYQRVLGFLRNANTKISIQHLKNLKSQTIGRKHKKGVSVNAVRDPALKFSQALDRLELEVVNGARTGFSETPQTLALLSSWAVAIATREVADNFRPLPIRDEVLSELAEPLVSAIRRGPAATAAFRKIVGPNRLMDAADLLNSGRSEQELNHWRRRRSLSAGVNAERLVVN